MVKILNLLVYYDKILPMAIKFPNIQGLGHLIQDRSFSPSSEFIKMVEDKRLDFKLIHADLCLMKRHLQFFNISYSFRDMSF